MELFEVWNPELFFRELVCLGLASSLMRQGHFSSISISLSCFEPKNVSSAGEAAKVRTRVKVSSQACHAVLSMFLLSTVKVDFCKAVRKRSRLMRKFRCTAEPKRGHIVSSFGRVCKHLQALDEIAGKIEADTRLAFPRREITRLQHISACCYDLRMLPLAARGGTRHDFGKSGWRFNAGVTTCSTRTGT